MPLLALYPKQGLYFSSQQHFPNGALPYFTIAIRSGTS